MGIPTRTDEGHRGVIPVRWTKSFNPTETAMLESLQAEAVSGLVEINLRQNINLPDGTDVLIGMGPAGGGRLKLVQWIMRFAALDFVMDKLGVPIPAIGILRQAGETLGLDAVMGKIGAMMGEVEVAVYFRNRLLGRMALGEYKSFRSSMARVIRDQMRVR